MARALENLIIFVLGSLAGWLVISLVRPALARRAAGRHAHSWLYLHATVLDVTRGSVYEVGPWTSLSRRCMDCGGTQSVNFKGEWRVEDLNAKPSVK